MKKIQVLHIHHKSLHLIMIIVSSDTSYRLLHEEDSSMIYFGFLWVLRFPPPIKLTPTI